MNRNRPGIEYGECQLSTIAWINVKTRNIDKAAEFDLCPDRNESDRIGRYGDDFFREQERELTRGDGERVTLGELAHRDHCRVGRLIAGRHVDFGTHG